MAEFTRRVELQDPLVVLDRLVERLAVFQQLSQTQIAPGGAGVQLDRLLVLGLPRIALGDFGKQVVEDGAARILLDAPFVLVAQQLLVLRETDDLPVRFGELRVVFDRLPAKLQNSIGVITSVKRHGLQIEPLGRLRIRSSSAGAG